MSPAPGWLDRLPTDHLLAEISLWSADLLRLGDDITRIDPFADLFHVDVADGHFSPALLLFPDQVAAIRKATDRPLHVHLMVADAILPAQVEQFAEAGADLISVHAENANAGAAIDRIVALGRVPGLVLRLETPVDACRPFLDRLGMLTLLGTEMGIKGVGLDGRAGPRLEEAALMLREAGHRVLLAADGGIREHTVPLLRKSGAQTIVMGSLAFGAPNLPARMAWVRGQ
jgi:ribulose-phosphate 3-epimerase